MASRKRKASEASLTKCVMVTMTSPSSAKSAGLSNSEVFSDIIVIYENEKFKAHKVILASHSTVLEETLEDLPAGRRELTLPITEGQETAMTWMLEDLYDEGQYQRVWDHGDQTNIAEMMNCHKLAIRFAARQFGEAAFNVLVSGVHAINLAL
ncbi:Hypothetical protein D9617_3g021470 [Elsinoe fawcettii]|nr:Hypothetical protein D9617_3g021470 [Elsinoe fawcettii]